VDDHHLCEQNKKGKRKQRNHITPHTILQQTKNEIKSDDEMVNEVKNRVQAVWKINVTAVILFSLLTLIF
jgi:hypothetical protein